MLTVIDIDSSPCVNQLMYLFIIDWTIAGKSENMMNYTHVFNSETLRRIAIQLPLTVSELAAVEGVAAIKAERYGTQFLEVTMKYTCNLSGMVHVSVTLNVEV